MKQVIIRQGQVVVEDVPAPAVESGTVLVRVDHSCISAGTEMSGVKEAGIPIWKRALRKPQAVIQAAELVASHGLSHARRVIEGKLSIGYPTGYSAAGTIVDVGQGIDDLAVGDRVACAGAQCAHHAEVICVPRNLTVPIPDNLGFPIASTVTLGAIALQGVRRASPTMGETFVVVGLGLLGQLTVQLLKAHGCRVIGTDLDRERLALAQSIALDVGIHPADSVDVQQVARLTDGNGADGVIITAASPSDEIVSTAFQMCRKKGRVVLVGDVGLNLNRADFYEKELDFFISTSYGPGRYDHRYEVDGMDYPIGYVRWTENRNMAEYLRLASEGRLNISLLINATFPIEEASAAYRSLEDSTSKRPLMTLLSYPADRLNESQVVPNLRVQQRSNSDAIRLGLIGAGSFFKGMHLPNILSEPRRFRIDAVASRTGHNATAVCQQVGARYATTDYNAILSDPEIDAVLITTRHDKHASQILAALQAGKHVFVEKPLAMHERELAEIVDFIGQQHGQAAVPILLTGFNRRFSPHARHIKKLVEGRSNPLILNYRMNAGYIPRSNWVHGPEGGGRNIGEACHIYDLFVYLTNSRIVEVTAKTIRPRTEHYSRDDNFVATMTFDDGSLATLTYTALGHPEFPKETLDVFAEGKVLTMQNYQTTEIRGSKSKGITGKRIEKGHKEELADFARCIQQGGEWPIPLRQQVEATRISFLVEEQIRPQNRSIETQNGVEQQTDFQQVRKAS